MAKFQPIAIYRSGVVLPYREGQFIVATEPFSDGTTEYEAGVYTDTPSGRAQLTMKGPKGDPTTIDDALSDISENPVQNKVVKAEFDKKLNKPITSSAYPVVPVVYSNGSESFYGISEADTPYTIPYRDENGCIKAGSPVDGKDATNKDYTDSHFARSLEFSVDNSTFVLTATLKSANGEILGTPQTVDLPLESVVVNGTYDGTTKSIILTLQNGSMVDIPVGDLVDGLASAADVDKKVDKVNVTSGDFVLYGQGHDGAGNTMPITVAYTSSMTQETVVYRNEDSTFEVGEPVTGNNPATMNYVDNNLSEVLSVEMVDSLF